MPTHDETGAASERGPVLRLLSYEERQTATSVSTERTGKSGKIAHITPHRNLVLRVDQQAEVKALRLAVRQMLTGEWETWLALNEGVLLDPLPKRSRPGVKRNWHPARPPATTFTVAECAEWYGRSHDTTERYYREARRLISTFRRALGLTGDQPRVAVWVFALTDEDCMRVLNDV